MLTLGPAMWQCMSTPPGMTTSPRASIVPRGPESPGRSAARRSSRRRSRDRGPGRRCRWPGRRRSPPAILRYSVAMRRGAFSKVSSRAGGAGRRLKSVLEPTPVTPACHPPSYRYAWRNVDRHVTARGRGNPGANRVDPGAELSRGGNIIECIDQHGAGRRGGPDAMRFSALRRDRARRRDRDVPARSRRALNASHCI